MLKTDAARNGGPMRIDTKDDLDAALQALARQCPHMANLQGRLGAPPLRRRASGFAGLAEIIAFQQISVDAARAIWTRVEAALGPISAEAMRATDPVVLKQAGLSRPKVTTLAAIAEAVASGTLPLDDLGRMTAEEAHAALVAVKGIGPWTADIYLLSCLGHPDAWPVGDIALQQATADLLSLPARPSAWELGRIGERWRPYRAVAARLLWAFYSSRYRAGRLMEPVST